MAMRLTPPTKNMFYLSTVCAIVAFVLYLFALLGVSGSIPMLPIAFWVAMLAWGLMTVGVVMKGI